MVLKGDCLEGHVDGQRPSSRGNDTNQGREVGVKVRSELWGVVATVKDDCRRSMFKCSGIFAD